MNVVVKELTSENEVVISNIFDILAKNSDPEVSVYFIHSDPQYKQFFRLMINNSIDKIFYCEDSEGNFLGFAHFKKFDNKVVLSKIIIDEAYQGLKIGKYLLIKSLKSISSQCELCEYFELDVFEKNNRALNWFLKLKMDISDYKNWYNITDYFKSDIKFSESKFSLEKSFRFIYDANGFQHLLYNNSHIGTLIDNTYLVIKTDIDFFLLNSMKKHFKKFSLRSVCMITKKELELFLIDKSFHLTIPFKKLKLV